MRPTVVLIVLLVVVIVWSSVCTVILVPSVLYQIIHVEIHVGAFVWDDSDEDIRTDVECADALLYMSLGT